VTIQRFKEEAATIGYGRTVPWITVEHSAEVSQVDLYFRPRIISYRFFFADVAHKEHSFVPATWVLEKNYVGITGCEP